MNHEDQISVQALLDTVTMTPSNKDLTLPQNFANSCSAWHVFSASICCRKDIRSAILYFVQLQSFDLKEPQSVQLIPLCSEDACEYVRVGAYV